MLLKGPCFKAAGQPALARVQVACLKKYMLVVLLQSGAVPPLPKHTAQLVT